MIVMVMRYYYRVDGGYVLDLAWNLGEAFWAEPAEGAAPLAEDGIEEDAQAGGKFDEVARVAEPGCAEHRGFAGGEEGGCTDGDGGWSGAWDVAFSGQAAP